MMKNVYIASSSKFIEECEKVSILIEEMDFVVTRKWWKHYIKDSPNYPKTMPDNDFYNDPSVKFISALDFHAVEQADLVIVITFDEYKLTGAEIELGYALALGKPVIILGKHKRSAMISSCIRVETLTELQRVLEKNFSDATTLEAVKRKNYLRSVDIFKDPLNFYQNVIEKSGGA